MGSIRWGVGLLSVALAFGAVIPAQAAGHPGQPSDPAGLDVLFVGAHPDDESGILSTLGQLHIDHRLRVGVVTVTRGEGGGNAVGTEEGPALGLVREAEERRALAEVGVVEVINLDKADFYYTVSAPLTDQVWGHDDTLDRLVRVVRRTRPKIVLTMDPAPSPGNHGNHQESARLAVEAYQAAADPAAFAEQISREGLRPWAVSRLFTDDMRGHAATGPNCVADFAPTEPTDLVWGVWAGARAPDGRSWAQVERSAQREYASQGWAGFPDVPTDPNAIGCDYLTQVASRVPYRTDHRGIDGVLDGTDGAGLVAEAGDYTVTPGSSTHVAVRVSAASAAARAKLSVPPEWQVSGGGELTPGDPSTAEFTVTVPRGATPGKVRLPVTVSSPGRAEETTTALLEVTAPVVAEQQPLPQVAQFREWARGVGHPELADLVPPVLTLPSGGSRDIDVSVRNQGTTRAAAGTVELALPDGFAATAANKRFPALAPGTATAIRFSVRNTDPGLATGMLGGDYRYTITVRPEGGPSSTVSPALELVPSTTIPRAAVEPTVDGVAGPTEYPGPELDVSSRWEGDECTSAADCSAKARLSWYGDTLFAAVTVTDDKLGSQLAAADCKRHWRTDSVELTIDPRGRSENTSTTFKLAALPVTAGGGPPCLLRDADNHQGDQETAPGVRVAAKISSPYTGYTVEFAVPLSVLPGAVDPAGLGLNLLVYDSDTQDRTGQTRIGWSTWGGVQGDPYRWGRATLDGYQPPAGRPTEPPAPVLPLEALASSDSPLSIEQSVGIGTPLGGAPAAPPIRALAMGPDVSVFTAEPGQAHVFLLDAAGAVIGQRTVAVTPGPNRITIPTTGSPARILVGFADSSGRTAATAARIR